MKKSVEIKLVMFRTVIQIVDANGTNWEGIPVFVRTYQNFRSKFKELESNSGKHEVVALGVRKNKDNLRSETIELTLPLIAVLKSLAQTNKDEALKARVAISPSALKSGSRIVLIQLIDRVLLSAEEELSSLEEYGITIDSVLTLKEKRDELYFSLMSPREAILEKKMLTKTIDVMVSEMNAILKNDLDQVMKVIQSANPAFYDSYFSARKTIAFRNHDAGTNEKLSN